MTVKKPQTTTLIDTFSEGYAAVNRRPWLVLVPILLNLYLWFGAQLSFAPLINDLHAALRLLQRDTPGQSELEAQYSDQVLALGQVDMRQQFLSQHAIFNFIPTLTMYVVGASDASSGAPGVPLVQAVPRLIDPQRSDTIYVSSLGGALLAFVLINALALPLSAAFLTQLAAAVRGDWPPLATWLRRVGRASLALLGYIGVFAGVMLALGLPFLFLSFLLIYLSPALGLLALSLLTIALFWARIYVGFAPEAIAVSGVGPLQAMYASFNIVRRNFWSTLGFLALYYVIAIGSGVIWLSLAHASTAGLIVAIVGSAYLSSGLLAARMAFYRERLRRWQGAVAPARPS